MQKTVHYCAGIILVVIAYLPFHALISTFLIESFGDKLLMKSLKELVILVLALPMFIAVIRNWRAIRDSNKTMGILVTAYVLLWLGLALVLHVRPLAEVAGLIAALRFVGFFAICYFVARLVSRAKHFESVAFRIVVYTSLIVMVFGALQVLILPKDFLVIFGYGYTTIEPYLTVDNNETIIRILSTLRGPNPLGAYLAVILPILIWYGKEKKWHLLKWAGVMLPFLITLYGSRSRSGLIGCVIALFVYVLLAIRSKKLLFVTLAGLVLVSGVAFAIRNTTFVQVTLLHRDPSESSSIDSDDQRIESLETALRRIAEKPFGHGVGSSGPASNYANSSFIIENYYLDIVYQVGWIGLLIFIAIVVYCVLLLYRIGTKPAYALIAGLFGVFAIGMFWPVWTDETVALIWWGLAGIVIGASAKRLKGRSLNIGDSR